MYPASDEGIDNSRFVRNSAMEMVICLRAVCWNQMLMCWSIDSSDKERALRFYGFRLVTSNMKRKKFHYM